MEINGGLEVIRVAIAAGAFLDMAILEFSPSATALVMRCVKEVRTVGR